MPTIFKQNSRPIDDKYNSKLGKKLAKRKLDTQRNLRDISPTEDFKRDYKKKKPTKIRKLYKKQQEELIRNKK